MDSRQLVILIIPLLIIQLTLMIVALVDLARRDSSQVQGGSRLLWALVIMLINLIGPILYLLWGREVEVDREAD
jgi:hypothetical protein